MTTTANPHLGPWLLACMMLALLLLAGCSSSDTNTNQNYAPIESSSEKTATNATGDQPAADSADATPAVASANTTQADDLVASGSAEVDEVVAVFDSFLALRAQVITNDLPLVELEDVATASAIEQVLQLRTENDARQANDSYAALSELAEWSNISQIEKLDDRRSFVDCTERQFVTPAGNTVISFVTNSVVVVDDGDRLRVDAVTTTQNGSFTTEAGVFGCVPPSFAQRAEQTAQLAVDEVVRLIADPAAALNNQLPAVFVEDARSDLERALEQLAFEGLSRVADESIELTVLGMDVNRPEFTVVVAVCRSYPTGRSYTTASGDTTVSDIPTYSTLVEWVYVSLEPVPAGSPSADVAVSVKDRGPNCQAERG